jgi:ribosomal protein S18 acetylase RimI-like enzyme
MIGSPKPQPPIIEVSMRTDAQLIISIRDMCESDFSAVEEVVQTAYRGGKSEVAWKNEHDIVSGPRITESGLRNLLNSKDALVLVAERASEPSNRGAVRELCGTVLIERELEGDSNQPGVVIGMLAVGPTAQNIGLGRMLVFEAERAAKARFGATLAHMHVASVRDELMQWYNRLGYSPTGAVKPFPGPEAGIQALKENLQFVVIEKRL